MAAAMAIMCITMSLSRDRASSVYSRLCCFVGRGRHGHFPSRACPNVNDVCSRFHPIAERGSALIYILIAIALLGALTMTFMEPSSQQVSAQGGFRVVTDIKSQVDTIRTAIQECVLSYHRGDATIDNSMTGSDPGARRNFPLKPNSNHFIGTEVGQTERPLAKDIRCPGSPEGAVNNHAPIFSGANGKYMPPVPDLFEDWEYYNGSDGVYIWIKTNKTDAFLLSALKKLDESFAECEADIIDATNGAIELDSGSPAETQCESGYRCLRVRLSTNTTTAIWKGDTEGDESSCP
jgi:hypothetical protein